MPAVGAARMDSATIAQIGNSTMRYLPCRAHSSIWRSFLYFVFSSSVSSLNLLYPSQEPWHPTYLWEQPWQGQFGEVMSISFLQHVTLQYLGDYAHHVGHVPTVGVIAVVLFDRLEVDADPNDVDA